jgi:hypothetical protein
MSDTHYAGRLLYNIYIRLLTPHGLLINTASPDWPAGVICSMKLIRKIKNRKELWIDILMFLVLATAIALLAVII